MRISFLTFIGLLSAYCGFSQSFNAIHGSNYAGALGASNNPASIVNTPYKWDITLFAVQYRTITNAIKGRNFPSFLMQPNSPFIGSAGDFSRKAAGNFNIRLINARIALDKSRAIAFGINLHAYTQATSSPLNYNDSVRGPRTFLFYNAQNRELSANLAGSAWMEVFATYGRTLFDRSNDRLNAAITVKMLKGLSGAFVDVRGLRVEKTTTDDVDIYSAVNGVASYGYSANLESSTHSNGLSANPADLFRKSKMGLAIDLGIEYLIKEDGFNDVFADNSNDYLWKIGASLLDLGWNNYAYSSQSRTVSSLKDGVTGLVLQEKFGRVKNISAFNDSLSTIINQSALNTGNFSIMNPARLKINVDRYLYGSFYINGDLSINLSSLAAHDNLYVQESKVLTITPRWETRTFGFYLPMQYNRQGNVWIGGALKAGPLLLGTHNLLNSFSKNNNISGGAYLALIIRPSEMMKDARNKQYECPSY